MELVVATLINLKMAMRIVVVVPHRKNEVFLMAIARKKKVETMKMAKAAMAVSVLLASPNGIMSHLIEVNKLSKNNTLRPLRNLSLEIRRLNLKALKIMD